MAHRGPIRTPGIAHAKPEENENAYGRREWLFIPGVAVLAYHILSMLLIAVSMRHAKARKRVTMELSVYYIALEICANIDAMMLPRIPVTGRIYEPCVRESWQKFF